MVISVDSRDKIIFMQKVCYSSITHYF